MNRAFKFIYILVSLSLVVYVSLPSPDFPSPLPDSLQSNETGDTEDPLRRAYFTNYSREEVILHYKQEFENKDVFGITFPTLRLNYPPEEAQVIIRDQTRSVFLEELIHPFRESFYINGFRAEAEKDTIVINDKVWEYKITVKYVPSLLWARVTVTIITLVLGWAVIENWSRWAKSVFKKK